MSTKTPDQSREWEELARRWKRLEKNPARGTDRFEKFHALCGDFLFDYSRHNIDEGALKALCDLARARDIEGWRARMFAGEKINTTEDRAVLHTDLRRPDAPTEVKETLARMEAFCAQIRGSDVTDVVNIGIGGSDLGPHMVCDALKSFASGPRVHFVSNVDGSHLTHTLKNLKPETTLFIVASKTFTTQETMTNARSAKAWGDGKTRFAAVSSNVPAAREFGVAPEHVFPLPDWVGGRYSVWSAIGLPVMLSIGAENFRAFLSGAHAADEHFKTAKLEENIPVLMALLGVWQRNFAGRAALAVLPYAQDLWLLPAWLQQLDMESNGKSFDRDGRRVSYATAPVIFGEPGTNGQHAFYQALHQGTDIVPCDFIIPVSIPGSNEEHQRKLLANALGQMEAFLNGQDSDNPWKIFEGGRPTSALVLPRLDPYYLGMLMAFYEHKIFAQGIIWNLNSFDQWGVELGKTIANRLEPALAGTGVENVDPSTRGLLGFILKACKA